MLSPDAQTESIPLTNEDKSLFSFPHQLSTWHCPHSLAAAAECRAAIDHYLLPTGCFAVKNRSGERQANDATDRQTTDTCKDPTLHTMQAVSKQVSKFIEQTGSYTAE